MAELSLEMPVRYLRGIGPKIAETLSRVGVITAKDLIFYLPREYEDRSRITQVADLKHGEEALVRATINSISRSRTKRGFIIIKTSLKDASGIMKAIWFNQPYLIRMFRKGMELLLKGKLDRNEYSGEILFTPRYYEILNGEDTHPIAPVYSLTEGLFQKKLRGLIRSAIDQLSGKIIDPIPENIRKKFNLPDLRTSVINVHYPATLKEANDARKRLIFDESLFLQTGILMRKRYLRENASGVAFNVEGGMLRRFMGSLPFALTDSQNKVISEIKTDMSKASIMNRLLQGDVGSGKTVVAMCAMIIAVQSGYQAAVMAPTEILAKQHFNKIKELLGDIDIDVLLLTGSEPASSKKQIYKRISGTKPYIIVGTHALIEEKVAFGRLGLVIIDEQQRFGVMQRSKLRSKGSDPDVLVMTATPIPRSLALTVYGDLERSVITEMPSGRGKVTTRYVQQKEMKNVHDFLRKEVANGRQVYIVYPLIEESEKIDLKAVKTEYLNITGIFPEFKVGLMHGRMKGEEKDSVMKDFKDNRMNILVSTTVIEVGIDVPNATIMLIEHADRFGLSQLHQLRGRIGRGSEKSYCFLAGELKSDDAKMRIKAMLESNDGFHIAEVDLKLRGPGEMLGTSQSGIPGSLLNIISADIIRQDELLKVSRSAAEQLISEDPELERAENMPLKQEILLKYGDFLGLGALN